MLVFFTSSNSIYSSEVEKNPSVIPSNYRYLTNKVKHPIKCVKNSKNIRIFGETCLFTFLVLRKHYLYEITAATISKLTTPMNADDES